MAQPAAELRSFLIRLLLEAELFREASAGRLTALVILAEIGHTTRFRSARKLAA